ncbi:UvrD-helicase domain-containing protein [Luteimonas aquatica]|uniref:UvrD-helicase domain-containing protein n=1 Tax=Luteimonas aquatica TaxID=450364 RepID=UPI001F56A41F|nr:exodeoxyribonuclease V subunit beta [Luteimonas aquatica]
MSEAVFDTRLDARSLIEASAGTGKTYALAGLFVRAVIERRLRVPQILAVTYTVAATQELRARVRRRLERAQALAAQWREDEHGAGDDAETAQLRALLRAAIERGESAPALRRRLARAARDLDLAAISTIHGFCQRVLAEHALETAQPLLAAEVEARDAAARLRLSVELWRAWSQARPDRQRPDEEIADDNAFLRRRFGDLAGLAAAIDTLLAPEPLLPPAPPPPDDPRPAIAACWRALRAVFDDQGEAARDSLLQAIADKVLHNNQYKPAHVEALWRWLAMHAPDSPPAQLHDKLAKYAPPALEAGTSQKGQGRTPQSPLFAHIAAFCQAQAALPAWQEACDLRRLHALRADAVRRDAAHKTAFNLRDFDDLIGAVHDAAVDEDIGPPLAAALRAQFPLVLVDEFQDTDARQWAIFEALFGGEGGGLVLVGDPKQAIYRFRGGDVHTYLRAKAGAEQTQSLRRNFRSRPAVLRAVEALFADAPPGALGEDIAFEPVAPGGGVDDGDLRLDGRPAPALGFHRVPPREDGKDWNKDDAIRIAAALCADAIRDRLQCARAGRLLRRDAGTGADAAPRPLEPRDCAVLVRTHREAEAVRHALARRGVPAVASGRISLFQTEEAGELLTLLLALRGGRDDRRLRAALATRLLGCDAARIDALDREEAGVGAGAALRAWQQRFEDWRTRWERHGPQALLAQVVAEQAPRLLGEADGERRVTNFLQLGELLQEAGSRKLGTQGQLDWLRGAMADAEPDKEAQQPRLESDAGRVHILTLHKSKGLEYPLVFLPFAGIGRDPQRNLKVAVYAHEGGRVRQWKTEQAYPGAPPWSEAVARHVEEDRAEDMRLLYVGLTRARDALWLCGGALADHADTALARLLQGPAPSPTLRAALGDLLEETAGLPDAMPRRLPPAASAAVPPARIAARRLQRDWWIHSFSQLHQHKAQGAHALAEETPADDLEPPRRGGEAPAGADARWGGTRFGNALHHALEHVEFAAWRDLDGDPVPDEQRAPLLEALRSQHYREPEFEAGLRALAPLVARTLNAPLPEGVRLCELPPTARVSELEFHFALRGAASRDLLRLAQAHGLLPDRHDFGAWPQLSGLMTGKLDLVYRVGERVHVLDYKSNLLPAYDQAALAERMRASEYDLQALLYAVALQRWLRLRLGAAYDFERHFGGARYLFCRGLDARDPTQGVFVPELPRALVDAAEALLAGAPA